MKKPWHKADLAPGNVPPAASENYTPLTMHQVSKPGAQQRAVGASVKPARDNSERSSASAPLRVNVVVRNRGPRKRMKRATSGKS